MVDPEARQHAGSGAAIVRYVVPLTIDFVK